MSLLPTGFSFFPEEFRRSVFLQYEKRLRKYSNVEKVFNYFASEVADNGEARMTILDLLRALQPVLQPTESGRVRVGRLQGEPFTGGELEVGLHHELMQQLRLKYLLTSRISLPEFSFIALMWTLEPCQVTSVFKLTDTDGDGTVSPSEFRTLVKSLTHVSDSSLSCSPLLQTFPDNQKASAIARQFFGDAMNRSLSLEQLVEFVEGLQHDAAILEFVHYDSLGKNSITPEDYAHALVAFSPVSDGINRYLKRIKGMRERFSKKAGSEWRRLTFQEFLALCVLRREFTTLRVALLFSENADGLTRSEFAHATRRAIDSVCDSANLSDFAVDIIFDIFDADENGRLSLEEFSRVVNIGNSQRMGGLAEIKNCINQCISRY